MAELTPAQRERLEMLAEECAEVIQCVTKILRHGYYTTDFNNVTYNNQRDLERELKEVWVVYERMAYSGELGRINFHDVGDVWAKKLPYTHYQQDILPVNHPPNKPIDLGKKTKHPENCECAECWQAMEGHGGRGF